ncbi:pyridoxal phosphate-dependent aminotransferase [Arsenicibacter rosenii]|uniref:Aminotransferase n=1 Tax=Arsenicibacter rosenii TaxID=1750698 RepID=A0A1S2VRG8_9BACT|nr:pyridoxal phosphate-dependent aminotransferase [Arsenicibacter rosenii]OIN61040.1 hypothetical protein BLX24_02890 [Arsenicibacter rosenii]
MRYERMPIEAESPEETGYDTIRYNLAESSVHDRTLGEVLPDGTLNDLVLAYAHHRGKPELCDLIVADSPGLTGRDVLVCTGAATALFIIATTLLSAEDHLIVIRPNYSTNLETPRAIGCPTTIIDLSFEAGFQIDVAAIRQAIRPDTRLISITNPHNPTGQLYTAETLDALTELARQHNCHLLVDETYRDLNFQTPLQPYMAANAPHVISVCSLSKAFGVPGIRMGWIVCRDAVLMTRFLAAKEQIVICNSILDEAIAEHLLRRKAELLPPVHAHIRQNYAIISDWFAANADLIRWNPPQAGVVGFARINPDLTIDTDAFYHTLYHQYQTMVGAGHWFELPDAYMRIGFGYPTADELRQGLANIRACLLACR